MSTYSKPSSENNGICSEIRSKFEEFDTGRKGGLYEIEVMHLLNYMFRSNPLLCLKYKNEFSCGWEQEIVVMIMLISPKTIIVKQSLDEFCSMYEDATLRITIADVLDNFFVRFGSELGLLDKSKISYLVNAMLPSIETLGCTHDDREKIIHELLKNYRAISTVYEDIVVSCFLLTLILLEAIL